MSDAFETFTGKGRHNLHWKARAERAEARLREVEANLEESNAGLAELAIRTARAENAEQERDAAVDFVRRLSMHRASVHDIDAFLAGLSDKGEG